MTLSYGFQVIEHYDDCAPEPFGTEILDHIPQVGERLTLHWLDGRATHDVIVFRVNLDALALDVRKV